MNIIYKYLVPAGVCKIEMPKGAKIIKAGVQSREIYIWVQIDENVVETETRRVEVVGTGESFVAGNYIDTVFLGSLVFHVYERL